MNAAIETLRNPLGQEACIEVMIVYADTLTRSRVATIYQRLHRQLWEEFDFTASWWKFDYFAHPQIAEAATETVGQADLVFFAVKSGTELPVMIKEWIKRWPSRRHHRGKCLLALLEFADETIPMKSPTGSFLRAAAQRVHMDYLPYYTTEAVGGEPLGPPNRDLSIEVGGGMAAAGNPVQRWGLNE